MAGRWTFGVSLMYLGLTSFCAVASANENVVGFPKETGFNSLESSVTITERNRQVTSTQLPALVRSVLGIADGKEASGSGGHPFSTQGAGDESGGKATSAFPWSATGKLFMKFESGTFVCTASVVGKSVVVTAAHCVHNYGTGEKGFPLAVSFEPARNGGDRPFGYWTAAEWWVPKVYYEGKDKCSPEAEGVVCENDIALIVLDKLDGKSISELVGTYNLPTDPISEKEFGYFEFMAVQAAQITQLGYPSADYDGLNMIRTDSLGYQAEPNNVIIGSAQTGGSSGGPWLQNFGSTTSYKGTPSTDGQINTVTAVTSWGYNDDAVKIQGASRFGKNQTYTTTSNIRSLMNDVCKKNPAAC
jgi:V8-like Glu-specific endopeptidase